MFLTFWFNNMRLPGMIKDYRLLKSPCPMKLVYTRQLPMKSHIPFITKIYNAFIIGTSLFKITLQFYLPNFILLQPEERDISSISSKYMQYIVGWVAQSV